MRGQLECLAVLKKLLAMRKSACRLSSMFWVLFSPISHVLTNLYSALPFHALLGLSVLSPRLPCCADLALASESEESVLSPFSPFDSRTGLTGYEKPESAGAGNCSTDLSTGIAELMTSITVMMITLAARLKRCVLKFCPF
jgi:hypothetical protein